MDLKTIIQEVEKSLQETRVKLTETKKLEEKVARQSQEEEKT